MNKKISVLPAIMPDSFADLETKVKLVKDFAEKVQIDVMDGDFVPSQSWPYIDEGEWAELEQLSTAEKTLPEGVSYEVHLMVSDVLSIGKFLIQAGVKDLVVHAEVATPEICEELQEAGATVGLAMNTNTPLRLLSSYIDHISYLQLMGIDNVGYQGQKFNDRVIDKVRNVHTLYPDMTISVDGGVSVENSKTLCEAGARNLVVGSALFSADNMQETYEKLLSCGM